jgi:hypothetical protein
MGVAISGQLHVTIHAPRFAPGVFNQPEIDFFDKFYSFVVGFGYFFKIFILK